MTRLILWKSEGVTITRRGIWQRDRSIVDVVETADPELLAEFRETFTLEVAAGARRGERLEITEHEITQ